MRGTVHRPFVAALLGGALLGGLACGDDLATEPAATETDTLTSESTDTASDASETDTTEVVCGDAVIAASETCDDGNVLEGDGCSASCSVEHGWSCEGNVCHAICGDGVVIAAEEPCDDQNLQDGDGCDASCAIEAGFSCTNTPSDCVAICGDGHVVGTEACDDHDLAPGDGCSEACTLEVGWSCAGAPSICATGCGDGIVAGPETCDDLGHLADDGCSPGCVVEDGWQCEGAPSRCATICGDGTIVGPETCDDGGQAVTDGCSATCETESGWTCEGTPSACETHCGDGLVAGLEHCDDGNRAQGDGCSLFCAVDFGWSCAGAPSVCNESATIQAVALGTRGGCVLTTIGELGCFGENHWGLVGNGTDHNVVDLPAFALDHVVTAASGGDHTCALREDGTVWCWGHRFFGQLGPLGPFSDPTLPVEITELPAIQRVESGSDHLCAIDLEARVWCWGANGSGQLGRGTFTQAELTPMVAAMPDGRAAIDLALGNRHSCALLSDGTVACWGRDDDGQLGDGTLEGDVALAARVPDLFGVVDVNAGVGDSTCAVDAEGQLHCWGDNTYATLGIGNNVDSPIPVIVELPAAVADCSVGALSACALLVDGSVYCWGDASDSQLGYGDLATQSLPLALTAVPPAVVDIEVGAPGACLVTAQAERHCWGTSEAGYLGNAPAYQVDPSPVLFTGTPIAVVVAPPERYGVTCGVMADGTVQCAGEAATAFASSSLGAQGYFHPLTQHLTVPITLPSVQGALELDLGNGFACMRTVGDVQCWGRNSERSLGRGDLVVHYLGEPAPVVGLQTVDEVELGSEHACVRVGGAVRCWGDNADLQTGFVDSRQDQGFPVEVQGIVDATAISLGENHGCAIVTGGVLCWGDDGLGQLGDDDGNPDDSGYPVGVLGLPETITQIDLGQNHACVLADDTVHCWGANAYGQLGQGNKVNRDVAMPVLGLPPIVKIAAGWNYTCALSESGELWCWGYAYDGHLGDGGWLLTEGDDITLPTPFWVANGIDDVVAGNAHTCVHIGATWHCVGFPASGQLGDDTTLEPSFPRPTLYGL